MRRVAIVLLACGSAGCATPELRALNPNPLNAPIADFETVWRQTVNVVDDYFDIQTENRLGGRLVTKPLPGATLFEPFHGDSIGLRERTLCTLQTIRRFAIVTVRPAEVGGWDVKVEVFKEMEDSRNSNAAGLTVETFQDEWPVASSPEDGLSNDPAVASTPRTLGASRGWPTASRWIPLGRDHRLEQVMLHRIQQGLFLEP